MLSLTAVVFKAGVGTLFGGHDKLGRPSWNLALIPLMSLTAITSLIIVVFLNRQSFSECGLGLKCLSQPYRMRLPHRFI